MDENYMADNAEETVEENTEVIGDSAAAVETAQEEEQFTDTDEVTTEETLDTPDGAANTESEEPEEEQSVTRTQEFSRRLNDLSGRKVDEFISNMGWVNPYTNEPIQSQAQYNEFLAMQNAAEMGKDPVTESRISGLENQLRAYKEAEEENRLQNDPFYGPYYKQYKDDITGVLNLARQRGMNVSLTDVFNTVMMKRLPDIMSQQSTATAAQTIKSVSDKAKASPGGLGGESYEQKVSVKDMSKEQFDALYKRVMRGEKVILK